MISEGGNACVRRGGTVVAKAVGGWQAAWVPWGPAKTLSYRILWCGSVMMWQMRRWALRTLSRCVGHSANLGFLERQCEDTVHWACGLGMSFCRSEGVELWTGCPCVHTMCPSTLEAAEAQPGTYQKGLSLPAPLLTCRSSLQLRFVTS